MNVSKLYKLNNLKMLKYNTFINNRKHIIAENTPVSKVLMDRIWPKLHMGRKYTLAEIAANTQASNIHDGISVIRLLYVATITIDANEQSV